MSFYKDYKEFIDQPLHMLMGAAIALPVAWLLSMTMAVWAAFLCGALLSRAIWMLREWDQHKDHKHEIRWIWSKDLVFIDGGIIAGLVILGFIL